MGVDFSGNRSVLYGALGAGALGAGIGALANRRRRWRGALLGAIFGAGAGGLAGAALQTLRQRGQPQNSSQQVRHDVQGKTPEQEQKELASPAAGLTASIDADSKPQTSVVAAPRRGNNQATVRAKEPPSAEVRAPNRNMSRSTHREKPAAVAGRMWRTTLPGLLTGDGGSVAGSVSSQDVDRVLRNHELNQLLRIGQDQAPRTDTASAHVPANRPAAPVKADFARKPFSPLSPFTAARRESSLVSASPGLDDAVAATLRGGRADSRAAPLFSTLSTPARASTPKQLADSFRDFKMDMLVAQCKASVLPASQRASPEAALKSILFSIEDQARAGKKYPAISKALADRLGIQQNVPDYLNNPRTDPGFAASAEILSRMYHENPEEYERLGREMTPVLNELLPEGKKLTPQATNMWQRAIDQNPNLAVQVVLDAGKSDTLKYLPARQAANAAAAAVSTLMRDPSGNMDKLEDLISRVGSHPTMRASLARAAESDAAVKTLGNKIVRENFAKLVNGRLQSTYNPANPANPLQHEFKQWLSRVRGDPYRHHDLDSKIMSRALSKSDSTRMFNGGSAGFDSAYNDAAINVFARQLARAKLHGVADKIRNSNADADQVRQWIADTKAEVSSLGSVAKILNILNKGRIGWLGVKPDKWLLNSNLARSLVNKYLSGEHGSVTYGEVEDFPDFIKQLILENPALYSRVRGYLNSIRSSAEEYENGVTADM